MHIGTAMAYSIQYWVARGTAYLLGMSPLRNASFNNELSETGDLARYPTTLWQH